MAFLPGGAVASFVTVNVALPQVEAVRRRDLRHASRIRRSGIMRRSSILVLGRDSADARRLGGNLAAGGAAEQVLLHEPWFRRGSPFRGRFESLRRGLEVGWTPRQEA
jgi:hypothetical protein